MTPCIPRVFTSTPLVASTFTTPRWPFSHAACRAVWPPTRAMSTMAPASISSRVQAVVNLYGPTDLTTPVATGDQTVVDFFGGEKIETARGRYEQASPITHVSQDDPPTLIIHGTIDELVPVVQAPPLR